MISIHALLAESDRSGHPQHQHEQNFYPRSPCGERRAALGVALACWIFLSTLSLRRATCRQQGRRGIFQISIHALLAESDHIPRSAAPWQGISIHALLAESDLLQVRSESMKFKFLSTLSLRRATIHYNNYNLHCVISIHALLAESDNRRPLQNGHHPHFYPRSPCGERPNGCATIPNFRYFYPRSPCGERPEAINPS